MLNNIFQNKNLLIISIFLISLIILFTFTENKKVNEGMTSMENEIDFKSPVEKKKIANVNNF
jgi:hypothetical protein